MLIIVLTDNEIDLILFVLQKFMIEFHSIDYPNNFYFQVDKLKQKFLLLKEIDKNVEHF